MPLHKIRQLRIPPPIKIHQQLWTTLTNLPQTNPPPLLQPANVIPPHLLSSHPRRLVPERPLIPQQPPHPRSMKQHRPLTIKSIISPLPMPPHHLMKNLLLLRIQPTLMTRQQYSRHDLAKPRQHQPRHRRRPLRLIKISPLTLSNHGLQLQPPKTNQPRLTRSRRPLPTKILPEILHSRHPKAPLAPATTYRSNANYK